MEALPGLWEIIWSFPTAADGWDTRVPWMHHQFNRYCPALWCQLCGGGRLGQELHDGSVNGTPDVTDRHVLAHGTQTYVNVWPSVARGGNTDINANKVGRKECVTSSRLGSKMYLKLKIEKGWEWVKTFNYKQKQNENYKPVMLFLSLSKPGHYLKQQFFSLTESPSKAPVPVLLLLLYLRVLCHSTSALWHLWAYRCVLLAQKGRTELNWEIPRYQNNSLLLGQLKPG